MSGTVPASGPVSFSTLQSVFGGTTPIKFSDYFLNATAAYTAGVSGIPTTGNSMSVSQFRGKSKAGQGITLTGGNSGANMNTSGYTNLSGVAGVDDGSAQFTCNFSFYFFGTDYGRDANGGIYWNTNNHIVFGAANSQITFTATTGKAIAIGEADRRTNNFYYSSSYSNGNASYIRCLLYAQNNYNDGVANAIQWQITLARDSTRQYVEVRSAASPSTVGSYNITDGTSFYNTFGSYGGVSAGSSFVLTSDLNGYNWTFYSGYSILLPTATVVVPKRSVNVNFFPPSSAVDSRFWTGQGDLLMARSILWAAGSRTSGAVRVYLVWSDAIASYATDVQSKISSYISSNFPSVTLTLYNDSSGAPNITSTLTTTNYDVALVWTDVAGSSTWGAALQSFADAGGGLVIGSFANTAGTPIPNFSYSSYSPIQAGAGSQTFNTNPTLNTSSIVSHFITTGLSTFNVGTGNFGGQGVVLNASATNLVSYSDGTSLIAVQSR